jgi:hypothetical protein
MEQRGPVCIDAMAQQYGVSCGRRADTLAVGIEQAFDEAARVLRDLVHKKRLARRGRARHATSRLCQYDAPHGTGTK